MQIEKPVCNSLVAHQLAIFINMNTDYLSRLFPGGCIMRDFLLPSRTAENTLPGDQPGPTGDPTGPEKIPCHARLDSFSSFLILN